MSLSLKLYTDRFLYILSKMDKRLSESNSDIDVQHITDFVKRVNGVDG